MYLAYMTSMLNSFLLFIWEEIINKSDIQILEFIFLQVDWNFFLLLGSFVHRKSTEWHRLIVILALNLVPLKMIFVY